jgi:hypothetical protein
LSRTAFAMRPAGVRENAYINAVATSAQKAIK